MIATVVAAPSSSALAAGTTNVPTVQQLAAMRAEAKAIQAQLAAGAKTLDAARGKLTQLQHQATAAKSAADKLDAKLDVLRAQVTRLAGDLYERPDPDIVTRILSDDDVATSLQADQLLSYAESNRTEVLREVAVDTEKSKVLRAQADQNVGAATVVKKSVDAQVAALQAQATKAATKLQAAQAAYEKEQARLAAERAAKAKAARDEAARQAAARRARELANSLNASPAECAAASGTSYPSGSWGGYSDGLIPASALCRIIGGGSLRPDAAVAFNKMSQAYARAFGSPLCINASYRPYSDQVRLFREEPSFAAVPGTSNHGWGVAVDLGCGVQNYGSAQYRWMTQHAGSYGWVHPSWAVHNPFEPWHWEFGHPGGSGGT
ncbi:MAG: D-alanyl-D-alanine carboxypeptidase family protein [Acidothermaceae bacterium]